MPALLRGVDRAAFVVALAYRLRRRGVPVGVTAMESFTRALGSVRPVSRPVLYWTARVTLVRRHSEIEPFDEVFAAVFDDFALALDPAARRQPRPTATGDADANASVPRATGPDEDGSGLPWITLPPVVAAAADSDADLAVPERMPSEIAALADRSFEDLDPAEMMLLGRWLERTLTSWPTRRSRRLRPERAGARISVRPTIARARRTGWEAIELVRVSPVRVPRRVVMVCDVSQSMQAQTGAYLHLMRALTRLARAEVFAFATTLTRLTPVLAHTSAAVAIEQANVKVADRFGGTRIAANLNTLLTGHHGGVLRGAIVIIASDGWDSDPPAELARVMSRLRRRAHRVIWVNPRAAAPGFEPLVSTMAAALPFCDRLLPADDFRSLGAVVEEISRVSSNSPGYRRAANFRGSDNSSGSANSRA